MDIRYQRGKIYTIRCRDDDDNIYVGSTIETLSSRLSKHRSSSKSEKKQHYVLYQNVNNNWDNWYIELYELYPCNSKEELLKKEGEVIREIGTLNIKINGRTQKEYYEENKENLSEKSKKYRENNKEKRQTHYKQYRENNKGKIQEHFKQYRENNKEKIAKINKEYRENNKQKILENSKQYRENNRQKILEYDKEYYEDNKKKIAEQRKNKITCECGCEVRKTDLTRHKQTKKHLQLLDSIFQKTSDPEVNLQ